MDNNFSSTNIITFQREISNETYGKFIAFPFELGMGTTIANSLRRCLLSSIPGYAITALRLEYKNKDDQNVLLLNQFENIYGMQEDTLVFIEKLKRLFLRFEDEEKVKTIFLEIEGPTTITAKSFKSTGIKIINPDLILANLNEKASLFIELQMALGNNYVPVQSQSSTEGDSENPENMQTIGIIPVNVIFSPILKVNFNIENTRVGNRTNYEKIILEIWTKGTIKPEDALKHASQILADQFLQFVAFKQQELTIPTEQNADTPRILSLLNTPIETLGLSVRSSNCLRLKGIKTIKDIVSKNLDEIKKIKNLGKKSIVEIQEKLKSFDLAFDMDVDHFLNQSKQ